MDAELDESTVDDVVQCEDRIVSQSRALLPAGSQDQIQSKGDNLGELLRPLGSEMRLVMVERANCLAMYFICMTLAAFMSLRDQWHSQHLRRTIQSVFTFLSGSIRKVRLKRLTWRLCDYERCLQFFSSVQGKHLSGRTVL